MNMEIRRTVPKALHSVPRIINEELAWEMRKRGRTHRKVEQSHRYKSILEQDKQVFLKSLGKTEEVSWSVFDLPPLQAKANRYDREWKNALTGISFETKGTSNESRWCFCKCPTSGEMIACDNRKCKISWFHFTCVGLCEKPSGKWYCDLCRQYMAEEKEKQKDKIESV